MFLQLFLRESWFPGQNRFLVLNNYLDVYFIRSICWPLSNSCSFKLFLLPRSHHKLGISDIRSVSFRLRIRYKWYNIRCSIIILLLSFILNCNTIIHILILSCHRRWYISFGRFFISCGPIPRLRVPTPLNFRKDYTFIDLGLSIVSC